MKLTKCRIGDCVFVYNESCGIPDLTVDYVSGVNRDKEFFEPSKQVGSDTSKYKVVPPNHFACNLMHVGRDRLLPIALNHTGKNKYVSPAYTVFSIKDGTNLLRDYFFMMLKSDERDRYFWFHTDSSVRDGMSWDDFCDLTFNLPPIEVQQKYVNTYLAMQKNQQSYESGLDDLKLLCDAFIEELRRVNKCSRIEPFIERHDVRNGQNGTTNVMGISTIKEFREPTAKVNKNELSNYKVVKPRQFGFVQTTHNEKVFAYAFNNTSEDIVISSVNEVFSTDETVLVPEYLAMFFNRTEFDRYARYHSWGSARETFTWDDLINVQIPIVDITVQKSIADLYNAYKERKAINDRLKTQIKDLCPILIKGAIEEARA